MSSLPRECGECGSVLTGPVEEHDADCTSYEPAPAHKPRRALVDEHLVLDDHQRLLVAIEQQAADWTGDAAILEGRGGDLRTAAGYRTHAEQLRAIARSHTKVGGPR